MKRFLAAAAVTVLALTRCLPGDIRPPPGVIHLTVEGSADTTSGFMTSDGWQVTFDRLLIALGNANLGGDSCVDYADARYDRLYDVKVPGAQKLSDVYGLGPCDLRLRTRTPSFDVILEQGVTAADLSLMRTLGADPFVPGDDAGVSVYVRGQAVKGAVTKRFDWKIRRGWTFHDCAGQMDAGSPSSVNLLGGEALTLPITVHGEELFRADGDVAALRFDALAEADADGDQEITLEELGKVPGPPLDMDAGPDPADAGPPTLESLIYTDLVPRMVRIGESGPCHVDVRGGPGR